MSATFGAELKEMLISRGIVYSADAVYLVGNGRGGLRQHKTRAKVRIGEVRQKEAAFQLGISREYLSALLAGERVPPPSLCDSIVLRLAATEDEAIRLHRAAARDKGYRVDG